MLKIYGLKTCDTTRKAMKWLSAHQITATFMDVRETPPSLSEIESALAEGIPAKRMWNTSGAAYREGGYKEKANGMNMTDVARTLSEDAMLLKRPFIVGASKPLVGFVESEYEAVFSNPDQSPN